MKVRLKTSGGLLATLNVDAAIDTGDLPRELAERIERGLASPALADAAAGGNPALADGTVYEITVLPDGPDGDSRRYVVDDGAVADEILDVLDLILDVARDRRREARERGGDG